MNVGAAVEHIGLVLRTARRDAANRVAGQNAVTHAFTYLELLRSEIERLSETRMSLDEAAAELGRLHREGVRFDAQA